MRVKNENLQVEFAIIKMYLMALLVPACLHFQSIFLEAAGCLDLVQQSLR